MPIANITVVTPSIPPRACAGGLLDRAVESVRSQTLTPVGGHVVVLDVQKLGAAATRQRALDAVRTEWVAFLDDDDYFYPHHLQVLYDLVSVNQADYSYSWFDGNNPFPLHRGRQMNVLEPHHTTMTVMVRTEIAQEAGFLQPDGPLHQEWAGEDWQFQLKCIAQIRKKWGDATASEKIVGTRDITWCYAVHGGNTSGLPNKW